MTASHCRLTSRRARVVLAGLIALPALLCALLLSGCARGPGEAHSAAPSLPPEQIAFWQALESACGQAFEGRIVEDTTANPDFAQTPLIMHVRRCEENRILIPFHVGEDRSRTWIITKIADGLRLKHDHRHEDGSEDEITQYGGDTKGPGSPRRQEFYADEHTASLIPLAATNIWTMEIVPGRRFAYALRRVGTDRRFRVEFDLSRPVAAPPPPWGHE